MGRRPGASPEALPEEVRRRVRILNNHPLNLSSSEISLRVREGRSIRYLVPDAVADYIAAHGLYVREKVRR